MGARGREAPIPLVTMVVSSDAGTPTAAGVDMTSFFPNPHSVVQAVGSAHQQEDTPRTDRAASLRNATELGADIPGVNLLGASMRRNFGTYELVELVQQVGARFSAIHPTGGIGVGDLSLRRGGTIRETSGRRVHSSHRNGLDVDVRYLYRDCHLRGRLDDGMCPLGMQGNLELMRMFVDGGPDPDESMVDVIYVGKPFQQRLCKHLARPDVDEERYREVVDRLQVMSGHQAHFHVRIKCPESSLRCPAPRLHRPDVCLESSRRGF